MSQIVTDISLDSVFTKEDRPYQTREFNLVFEIDTVDSETGAAIMSGEFRTIASDEPLTLDEAKDRMRDLIERDY